MRAQHDAVGVGIGTARADDPRLTVRIGPRPRVPPIRVVFDRDARLPMGSHLVRTSGLVPTVVVARNPDAARELRLFNAGVEVIRARGLTASLQLLRRHEVRSLLLEGGPTLARAFLAARLVDRIVIFRSPRRLGAGAIAAFDDASFLDRLQVMVRRRCGVDVVTTYAPSSARPDVHRPRHRRRHD
jgi:diaminohydroxyphosphoribosylaminopyrimidine deaminase/5-amino-6-(5-phosphoribosylamino)uracil reductase